MFKRLNVFLASTLHSLMVDCSDLDANLKAYHLEIRKWAELYGTTLFEFQADKLNSDSITSSILRDRSQPQNTQSNYQLLSEFIINSPPALILIHDFNKLDSKAARFLSRITTKLKANNSSWKIIYLGRSSTENTAVVKLLKLDSKYSNEAKGSDSNSRYAKSVSGILGLAAACLILWFIFGDEMADSSSIENATKTKIVLKDDSGQQTSSIKVPRKADDMQEWENHISEFEMMMSKYSDSNEAVIAQTIEPSERIKQATKKITNNKHRSRPEMSSDMLNAVLAGKLADLIMAIKAGSDIDSVSPEKLESALIIAATAGHKSMVSWLIDSGADINQADTNERSSLFYAAVNGHHDITKLLLSNGANPNSPTKFGKTPLMAAVHNNHVELSKLLVNANTDINLRDHSGWSALFYASWNNNKTIGDLLLKNGAKPKLKDNEGYTARDIAMAKGSTEIAELF